MLLVKFLKVTILISNQSDTYNTNNFYKRTYKPISKNLTNLLVKTFKFISIYIKDNFSFFCLINTIKAQCQKLTVFSYLNITFQTITTIRCDISEGLISKQIHFSYINFAHT